MDSEGKKVELIHFECWKPSILKSFISFITSLLDDLSSGFKAWVIWVYSR